MRSIVSTPSRITLGTGLTLVTMATNIIGQIVTVPVYLSRWNAETYGVWLIMIGAFGYVYLLSAAFQQYAYGEMLKAGAASRDAVRTIYRTSLAMALVVAATELTIVAVLTSDPFLAWVAPDLHDAPLFGAVVFSLLLYSVSTFLIMPVKSITAYANILHGHYPRVAAWVWVNSVFCLAGPTIAVLAGADFRTAAIVYVLAQVASILPALAHMLRLAWREGLLQPAPVVWRQGWSNALCSLPLAGRSFIDSFRQQGFRILLGANAGPIAVTTLATTRVFANVLHQGLGTITAPLMPELMRYVIARDQDRTEGAFAVVWLFVFAMLVPGALALCLLAEPIFVFWTRGAVAFDRVLFLMLLVVVLFYAASQPAAAILQGHNRIGWMIAAAVVAAVGLGIFAVLLVPPFGLLGAGFALLGAEICAAAVTVAGARRTLWGAGLVFPMRSFALVASTAVAVFALGLPAVTLWADISWAMALPFAANAALAVLYWATIPALARDRIRSFLGALRARLRGVARARPGESE